LRRRRNLVGDPARLRRRDRPKSGDGPALAEPAGPRHRRSHRSRSGLRRASGAAGRDAAPPWLGSDPNVWPPSTRDAASPRAPMHQVVTKETLTQELARQLLKTGVRRDVRGVSVRSSTRATRPSQAGSTPDDTLEAGGRGRPQCPESSQRSPSGTRSSDRNRLRGGR